MLFRNTFLITALSLFALNSFSQISSGKVENQKKEENKNQAEKKVKQAYQGQKKEFVGISIGRTVAQSTVESNKYPYGFPLGLRTNESSFKSIQYGLNYTSFLKKHVGLRVGLNVLKMGESYAFKSEVNDSMFNYNRVFNYVGLPLNAMFSYGNQLKINALVGLTPLFFTSSVYTENSKTAIGELNEIKIKSIQGFTALNVGLNVGVELLYHLNENLALGFSSNYTKNLISTYNKTGPYIHKSTMMQYNVGLYYAF